MKCTKLAGKKQTSELYAIFRRDPRAQLLIDDPTGFRAVLIPATVQIREDLAAELPRFRAIREKHGLAVPGDDEHLRALTAEGRLEMEGAYPTGVLVSALTGEGLGDVKRRTLMARAERAGTKAAAGA